MDSVQQLKKGTAETLVLAVLAESPSHGYAIAREIEKRSADVLSLGEGSLYPVLRGLEGRKLVTTQWEPQETGPARRGYTLTESGLAELRKRPSEWNTFASAVSLVLGNPHA